jgi:mannitol/fructose-specific phosphotransferase system IIA component
VDVVSSNGFERRIERGIESGFAGCFVALASEGLALGGTLVIHLDFSLNREPPSTAFGGRFAIPHATRMDARRTVVGVLVSRGGIAWGGSCVNVVLLLAVSATDRQRFVSIFDALAQALWGEGEVARLSRCESFGEFRDELRAGMCLR